MAFPAEPVFIVCWAARKSLQKISGIAVDFDRNWDDRSVIIIFRTHSYCFQVTVQMLSHRTGLCAYQSSFYADFDELCSLQDD